MDGGKSTTPVPVATGVRMLSKARTRYSGAIPELLRRRLNAVHPAAPEGALVARMHERGNESAPRIGGAGFLRCAGVTITLAGDGGEPFVLGIIGAVHDDERLASSLVLQRIGPHRMIDPSPCHATPGASP
jgi:hypothetical protein